MSLLKQWKNLKLLTIGNLLPDDDDLLSSVIGDIGFVGQINDRVDIDDDIFYRGGGMKLEVDNNSDANKASALVVQAANEQLSGPNGLFSGVRSLEVDFEKQKVVVVVGDNITPFEILNGVLKDLMSWRSEIHI
ncbi:protein MEI2-like 4 [Zingiber officinale]|uniref:protein MEI2-like 4 n=1 Tax=Zingiber officinale TaxID=94328 RepID=UPI001C4A775A|nr:protein MEI2-like 4 [Zingiber officinale]